MVFKKGYKATEEHKINLSLAHMGIKSSDKQKETARQLFLNHNPMKNPEIAKKVGRIVGNSRKDKPSPKRGKKYPLGEKHWKWNGGISKLKSPDRYGDDWDAVRRLVYERDGYICQKCKQYKPLDVHHIIPFMKTFDNSLGNLISLCRSCHMKEENRKYG